MVDRNADGKAALAMLEHAFRNVHPEALEDVSFSDIVDAFEKHRLNTRTPDAAGGWEAIESAPFDRMVLVDCERFDAVCEAIQYRKDGWTTFGANGPYACRPRSWMEKPARFAPPSDAQAGEGVS